ncbi:hypothetical protein GGH96_000312 [Coemansia sp. RSA 1972]|nr:hypothetical protein GGH96_000312 [Coemansia sp. RSA 1972]
MHFISTSVFSVLAILGTTAISSANAKGCSFVNQATTDLIKSYDEFSASPATKPSGQSVIGYGHMCTKKGCTDVPYKFPLTQVNAEVILVQDMEEATQCLNSVISNAKLNANQWGALASWALTAGCSSVEKSTLVGRLNTGEDPNTVAEQELPTYNKDGGNAVLALKRRRDAEVLLFKTPSSEAAFPDCPFD